MKIKKPSIPIARRNRIPVIIANNVHKSIILNPFYEKVFHPKNYLSKKFMSISRYIITNMKKKTWMVVPMMVNITIMILFMKMFFWWAVFRSQNEAFKRLKYPG